MSFKERTSVLSRRGFLSGCAGAGALALLGCSEDRSQPESPQTSEGASAASAARPASALAPQSTHMVLYKDPNCGCCEAWAEVAREGGFHVEVVEQPDMTAVKDRLGVPEELRSCHTSEVGGYVVEGHVPLDDVRRLLEEKPSDVTGIAVPGMPRGSPGMETPDGTSDPYQVIAFGKSGSRRVYATYEGSGGPQ